MLAFCFCFAYSLYFTFILAPSIQVEVAPRFCLALLASIIGLAGLSVGGDDDVRLHLSPPLSSADQKDSLEILNRIPKSSHENFSREF